MSVKNWCVMATMLGPIGMAWGQSHVAVPNQAVNPGQVLFQAGPDGKMPEAIAPPPGAVAAPADSAACEPPKEDPLGPTAPQDVKCLQNALGKCCDWFAPTMGCDGKEKAPCLQTYGWIDLDYTYRSSGKGINFIAPVLDRFGDEFLCRQIGYSLSKPLDAKEWSLGFNAIFIAGADASFLSPTAGGWKNTDPRFGTSFTDLNVSAHLDILTEGGVDVKMGRQTTCFGPMGALPFQRYFDTSDYAWYNEEEGRYTGVSANWKINKQLSWYNGIEFGGWGVFYSGWDFPSGPCYLGQVNYWLDCEAKKTLLTATILTGPTGTTGGNTSAGEFTIHQNWSKYVYQVASFQWVYSKAGVFIFGPPPPGYLERSYSVYSYQGVHLNCKVDLNSRVEWYRDVDGGVYAGGFGPPAAGGSPKTDYWEVTAGIDYHPVKWLQIRPEVRYDFANNPAFGDMTKPLHNNQLVLACDALIKF